MSGMDVAAAWQKLDVVRRARRMSMQRLAGELGVSRRTLYGWRSGGYPPSPDNWDRIVDFLEAQRATPLQPLRELPEDVPDEPVAPLTREELAAALAYVDTPIGAPPVKAWTPRELVPVADDGEDSCIVCGKPKPAPLPGPPDRPGPWTCLAHRSQQPVSPQFAGRPA